jgi:hypothetical protein
MTFLVVNHVETSIYNTQERIILDENSKHENFV